MRIGLDCDGVIYNIYRVYNQKLIDLGHDVDLDKAPEIWDYFSVYGYTREEFNRHLDELVDERNLFWKGELCEPGIPAAVGQMRAAGHTIHIVTNRYSGKVLCSQEATKHFLSESGIEYDELVFTADKTSVQTDIFLEDNKDNYDALKAAGVQAYLVDRPYNQDLPGEYRQRVGSFWEFAEKILLMSYWTSKLKERKLGLPSRNSLRGVQ